MFENLSILSDILLMFIISIMYLLQTAYVGGLSKLSDILHDVNTVCFLL